VVGDDGVDGIVIGPGSADGEAYAAFQSYARSLNERGVILAVCSKNDAVNAEAAFAMRAEMVLKRDDIAVFVANWSDKAANLRSIAETLQIGVDSLVLFDDNPAERRLVREQLPQVGVPEVPLDPALYARCLADAGYFEATAFTPDDVARARQYADNARRRRLEAGSSDLESFLRGLGMELVAAPFQSVDLPRVVQLINKTNQFNLRTRRLSEAEVRALMEDPDALCLQFRLTDCLGDNGLISVVVALPQDPDSYLIDTWLMSCRVLGRQVEEEVLNTIVERARARGRKVLIGEYLPTAKNRMVSDLLPRLGFEPAENGHAGPGSSRWQLNTVDFARRSTYITTRHLDG
jgi:FkbH-like protein